MRGISLLCLLLGFTACDSDDPDAEFCADVPVLTWENHGMDFVNQNCQPCHASTTADRNGAPSSIYFDSVEDVSTWSDQVLERITGESPTMPPGGGVAEDERLKTEIWIRCFL
jgi:uncharacterized membrane protein